MAPLKRWPRVVHLWPFKWTGPRITKKNKDEAKIAYKLGGVLTKASGAIQNNGDVYLDSRFLIEHKTRSGDPIYIPWSVFEKIQEQAHARGRIPILAVTDRKTKYDFIILEENHLLDIAPDNLLHCWLSVPSKRIRISVEDFIQRWAPVSQGHRRFYQHYGSLAILKLEDFRDLVKI